ncbi:hypothetical protein AN958_00502 [Leucoagaricus sp. SymC.cos]|nr:hypothetical protein AN958_00502 [Leucoagaricus sp. SymC.cos]
MANDRNGFSKITSLPLDILISLMDYLRPLDLIALRKSCRALHDASHQRIVWIKALTEVCIANDVFLPTFQLDRMTTQELLQAAAAPSRWLKNVFLVPGGRFVVILTLHSLQLWDLEHVGKGGGGRRVTSVKMSQEYNITFSAQPTKDGMGLRLVVPSYPMDTAARKQISVYEIFPLEDQPTLSEIAHLGVNSTCSGISPRLTGDLVVFLDNHTVKVWDFVNNLWAEWNTHKDFLKVS